MIDTKLPEEVRKIASKMYPQTVKDSYSQWEVERLLIAVCNHYTQAIQSAKEEEKEKCKQVFIENVDWAEWSMDDRQAGECFEEGYQELTAKESK